MRITLLALLVACGGDDAHDLGACDPSWGYPASWQCEAACATMPTLDTAVCISRHPSTDDRGQCFGTFANGDDRGCCRSIPGEPDVIGFWACEP